MEAADFYTGIVAELYAPLKSTTFDPEPYAAFIRESGEPALELGCGDGEPLLTLRERGIDVEGVDSSRDMLDRCLLHAESRGLNVTLHHQKMEELDLSRRYRSIFLAGPTITLLPDDQAVLQALHRIRTHLEPEGSALVPLFLPSPSPVSELCRAREATAPDGALLRVSTLSQDHDDAERVQRTVLRYERHAGEEHAVVDRTWTLHWHTQEDFRSLAEAAGLGVTDACDGTGNPASCGGDEFAFRLHRMSQSPDQRSPT